MTPTRLMLMLGVGALLVSCTPVRAWEKEDLARPTMQLSVDPLADRFHRHVEHSKEGSSGGYGIGGGGCGCT